MTVPHSSSSQRCVAVVTGAASGIGAALTRSLLARGSTVIAIDLDATSIDERAERVSLDVRDAHATQQLADRFVGTPVTHVFANAGVGGAAGDVLSLPDSAWQWTWEVNVIGALRTLRSWWPHLCLGQGKAVATLSPAAMSSFPGAGPYRASKAALLAALEGLHYQAHLQRSGVTVHAPPRHPIRSPSTWHVPCRTRRRRSRLPSECSMSCRRETRPSIGSRIRSHGLGSTRATERSSNLARRSATSGPHHDRRGNARAA